MKTKIFILLFTLFSLLFASFCKRNNSSERVKSKQTNDFVANRKELTWLKDNCFEITTVQPEKGFDDLQALKKMIGDARIVGLGEFSHGSSDVFRMKHRLIDFLVSEMGFNIFSIEENMPVAYQLNNYVLNGEGDPNALLKDGNWIWNTQEVLDIIEWMRKFNSTGKGRIQYTGFDMQDIMPALANVCRFAEQYDKTLKPLTDSIKKLIEAGQSVVQNNPDEIFKLAAKINVTSRIIVSYLKENRNSLTRILKDPDYKWLLQNANLMVQSTQAGNRRTMIIRDSCMAENVRWLLNENPDSKIILWAHNQHIAKQKGMLGNFLTEKFGTKYYNIGFLSNSGTLLAYNMDGINSNSMEESKPGSFEYSFHKTKIPIFFFDFSKVNNNAPQSGWLLKELNTRFIGSYIVKDSMIISQRISNLYNSVIYIDSSHASHRLSVY